MASPERFPCEETGMNPRPGLRFHGFQQFQELPEGSESLEADDYSVSMSHSWHLRGLGEGTATY